MLHAAGGVQRAVLLFYRRSPLGRVGQEYAVIATTIGMFLTETVLFASALLLSALPKTYRGGGKAGGRDADFFYAADIAAGYTSRC